MLIKNLLLRSTLLVLIISVVPANAAGVDPALTTPAEQTRQQQLESQEQQRQQEILKSLRQQQEIKPDARLVEPIELCAFAACLALRVSVLACG